MDTFVSTTKWVIHLWCKCKMYIALRFLAVHSTLPLLFLLLPDILGSDWALQCSTTALYSNHTAAQLWHIKQTFELFLRLVCICEYTYVVCSYLWKFTTWMFISQGLTIQIFCCSCYSCYELLLNYFILLIIAIPLYLHFCVLHLPLWGKYSLISYNSKLSVISHLFLLPPEGAIFPV